MIKNMYNENENLSTTVEFIACEIEKVRLRTWKCTWDLFELFYDRI